MNNMATYTEIEESWNIHLVYEANMVLSYKMKLDEYNQKKAEASE